MEQKCRSYCGTWFQEEDLFELMKETWEDKIKYLVVGKEKCPTTGKKHQQWFVSFKNPLSRNTVKKLTGKSHFENCKGSDFDNEKYCKKDGKFQEFGTRPKQGKRTDLVSLKDRIKSGESSRAVLEDCDNYQQIRFVEKQIEFRNNYSKRDWKTHVTWIYGPSGVGKTYLAKKYLKDKNYWKSGGRSGFYFNKYDGQEYMWLEEFRGNIAFEDLLALFDDSDFRVDTKGSSCEILAKKIIVTSPLSPEKCYKLEDEDLFQLTRRIEQVIHLTDRTEQKSVVIL